MATLNPFSRAKRLVIKIGSAILVDSETGALRGDWLAALARDIQTLRDQGLEIIIVSSGAIALGRGRLGLMGKALTLPQKQACAATGQSLLTQQYEKYLSEYNIKTAQALLTINDTEDRRRWLNARSTLSTLLSLNVIPIINENDTISTTEIRFGDNDRLAARTAQMLGADTLILLSDIDGLYTADPRKDNSAQHIPEILKITDEIMAMGGDANSAAGIGTGGMATKLAAAQMATSSGCDMAIMDGRALSPLSRLIGGDKTSWFKASTTPGNARREWIRGSLKPKGQITIDEGAVKALGKGKSLLAAGATTINGEFQKGDCVSIHDEGGVLVGLGIISYDADEARAILGQRSDDIATLLGYEKISPLIHRDNLVWDKNI